MAINMHAQTYVYVIFRCKYDYYKMHLPNGKRDAQRREKIHYWDSSWWKEIIKGNTELKFNFN